MKLSSCIQIPISTPKLIPDVGVPWGDVPASGLFLFFRGNVMSEIEGGKNEAHVLCLGVLSKKVSDRPCGCPGRSHR